VKGGAGEEGERVVCERMGRRRSVNPIPNPYTNLNQAPDVTGVAERGVASIGVR
jgi:hypothetical protein